MTFAILSADVPRGTMATTMLAIRAHFDGNVIIPDEPVALPRGTSLTVSVHTASESLPSATLEERQRAFDAFIARATSRPVPHLSDEATRRNSIDQD